MDLSIKDLDWRKLLVKHYKAFGLNEKSLAVVFCLDEVLSSMEALIKADDLVPYMTLSVDEIDDILVDLVNRKYIQYSKKGGTLVTSLEPLKDKIFQAVYKDIVIDSNEKGVKGGQEQVNTLYSYFEDCLGRPLTGKEVDRISFWIKSGASEGMIKEAVEKLRGKNKAVTFPAVDKVLLALKKSDDRGKEGYSSLDGDWKNGDQDILDALKKSWVPKSDD